MSDRIRFGFQRPPLPGEEPAPRQTGPSPIDWMNPQASIESLLPNGVPRRSTGINPRTAEREAAYAAAGIIPRGAVNPASLSLVGTPLEGMNLGTADPWYVKAVAGLEGPLRMLSRPLEPLQLPQDVLFAWVASIADPTGGTFTERFLGDQNLWQTLNAYLPYGVAPPRPTSGSDILNAFGVENATARNWGGFALDLFADPLLAGGFLKAAGSVARMSGAVDTANDLRRMGDTIDRLTAPSTAYNLIPRQAREHIEETMFQVAKFLLDRPAPDIKAIFSRTATQQAQAATRVAQGQATQSIPEALRSAQVDNLSSLGIPRKSIADAILPERAAMRLAAMSSVRDTVGMRYADDAYMYRQRANRSAMETQEIVAQSLIEASAVIGGSLTTAPERSKIARQVSQLLGAQIHAFRNLGELPTAVRQYISNRVYQVVDETALVAFDPTGRGVRDLIGASWVPDQPGAISAARRVVPQTTMTRVEFDADVRRIAVRNGADPNQAAAAANEFLERIAISEAAIGLRLSGYEPVMNRIIEAVTDFSVNQRGMTLQQAQRRAVQVWEGMMGRAATVTPQGQPIVRALDYSLVAANPRTGQQAVTVRDLLNQYETFSKLDMDTFMHGLMQGHMRRAMALTTDAPTYDRYVSAVESGKVLLSNVIQDTMLQVPQGHAFGTEFNLVRGLIDDLTSVNQSQHVSRRLPRATVLSSQTIIGHLMDNGVSAQRARETMIELVAQQNPVLNRPGGMLDQIRDRSEGRQGGQAEGFFAPRDTSLTREQLEVLGEFADPLIAVSQQANKGRQSITWSEFGREMYDAGVQNGWVQRQANRGNAYIDPQTGVRYVNMTTGDFTPGVWGAFAGNYVHPFLAKEMRNAMKDTGGKNGVWQRVRDIVTGGYLAAPNVLAANFVGGFTQAMGLGISPLDLIPSMIRTFKPLVDYGRTGQVPEFLQRMSRYFDAEASSLMGRSAVKGLTGREIEMAGLEGGGLRQFIQGFLNIAEAQLRSPGVRVGRADLRNPLFGLDGFQFVEQWFKAAAFDFEFSRLQSLGRALPDAERTAAELARLVVFDYNELPGLLKMGRDSGVVMFPGFPYFMLGRQMDALWNRPGVLGQQSRMADIITGAIVDENERVNVYSNMESWLREENGTVIYEYEHEDGFKRRLAIPLEQLIPTQMFSFGPMAEGASAMGLWRPLIETINALVNQDGEAIWSSRYGQQVFDPGATGLMKLGQTFNYLTENFSPAWFRKLGGQEFLPGGYVMDSIIGENPAGQARGVLGNLTAQVFDMGTGRVGESLYTANELARHRGDRTLFGEVLSATLRAPTIIATEGPMADIRRLYGNARRALTDEEAGDKARYDRARLNGNPEEAERIRLRIMSRRDAFREEWTPQVMAWSQAQGQSESPGWFR